MFSSLDSLITLLAVSGMVRPSTQSKVYLCPPGPLNTGATFQPDFTNLVDGPKLVVRAVLLTPVCSTRRRTLSKFVTDVRRVSLVDAEVMMTVSMQDGESAETCDVKEAVECYRGLTDHDGQRSMNDA